MINIYWTKEKRGCGYNFIIQKGAMSYTAKEQKKL